MKRKLLSYLSAVLVGAVIAVLFFGKSDEKGYLTYEKGNTAGLPMAVKPDRYKDAKCGMILSGETDAAEAIAPDGKTWFFDDVGCLALWLNEQPEKERIRLWVYARDAKDWVEARRAWYSLTDSTVMRYGFAAYKTKQEGFVDFDEMQLRMLRGENMTNPYFRKQLLGEH